jgi:diguanylate cyclase (GGDEF)-like protein
MTDQLTRNIIDACLEIEQRAAMLYGRISGQLAESPLHGFWREMQGEEEKHIEYWEGLAMLADKQALPQIVEEPSETLEELRKVPAKVEQLWERFQADPSGQNAFLIAYRMEFFLLHPIFAFFFLFMESPVIGVNPADDYDRHLHKFADELSRFGGNSPEIDLLGETLQEMWRRNSELARQSSRDSLTGILNRKGFFAALKPVSHLSQRNDRTVAVMVIDVDDFKQVNDLFGHPAGDEALRKVAAAMRSSVRASDLVARYGGDEFVVFLSVVTPGAAKSIAEDIRKQVEVLSGGDGVAITVSIGLAEGRLPLSVDVGIEQLIQRADASMYRAKRGGKNRVASYLTSRSRVL